MKLRSKSQLIELTSGVQVLLLAIALIVFGGWIQNRVGHIIREQIIEENQLIAQQLGRLLRTVHSGDLVYGDSNWEKFQAIVEETKLPNDGYICIADALTGELLCHPQIRQQPKLRSTKLDGLTVARRDLTRINLLDATGGSSQFDSAYSGIAGKKGNYEVISATRLPNVNGVLFVHQSEASTRIGVQKILTPLGYAGVFTGAILILVSTKLSTRIVSSYEHQLEEVNSGLEETVKHRTSSLVRTKNAVIFGLAKLAESRDSDTGEHLERISLYSTLLARAHSKKTEAITPEFIESIGLASSLHDIGKVGVADRVLLKPGKLTPEERIEIQAHPQIGEACLQAIDEKLQSDRFLFLAKEIAAFHHEKWDGSGYPYALKGDEIPISARIVAVADVYDALRSKRPYKNPLSHTEACKILAEGACTHFDPDIIDSFISVNREFEAISSSYLSPEEPEKDHESPSLLTPVRQIDQASVLVSS